MSSTTAAVCKSWWVFTPPMMSMGLVADMLAMSVPFVAIGGRRWLGRPPDTRATGPVHALAGIAVRVRPPEDTWPDMLTARGCTSLWSSPRRAI